MRQIPNTQPILDEYWSLVDPNSQRNVVLTMVSQELRPLIEEALRDNFLGDMEPTFFHEDPSESLPDSFREKFQEVAMIIIGCGEACQKASYRLLNSPNFTGTGQNVPVCSPFKNNETPSTETLKNRFRSLIDWCLSVIISEVNSHDHTGLYAIPPSSELRRPHKPKHLRAPYVVRELAPCPDGNFDPFGGSDGDAA